MKHETNQIVLSWNLAVFISISLILLAIAEPALDKDWFFDEAWRADMIRSAWTFDRYFLHNTPIPPGWLLYNWIIFEILPYSRQLLRIAAFLPAAIAYVLVFDILSTRLKNTFFEQRSRYFALATVLLAALLPQQAQLATYLNNYQFEFMLTALLLWSVERIERGELQPGLPIIFTVTAIGPFFCIAPMFVVPALAVALFFRTCPSQRLYLTLACAIGLVNLLLTYELFLSPVAERTIHGATGIIDYWSDTTAQSLGPIRSLQHWFESAITAVTPESIGQTLGGLIVIVFGVIGATIIWQVYRFWIFAAVMTQVIAVAASALKGWPIGFERLNFGNSFLITLLVPLGVAGFVCKLANLITKLIDPSKTRRTAPQNWIIPATLFLTVAVFLWPQDIRYSAANETVFARGLSEDMKMVAKLMEPNDVVVSHHFMASWYAHDQLITDSDRTIVLLDELALGRSIIETPQKHILELAPTAKRVWCVLPYELGPEGTNIRCQLGSSGWHLTDEIRGRRAAIRVWTKNGN